MPNDFLRDRIQRKLAGLPDDRLYQVLDFVEFLETKYAEAPSAAASTNFLQRFAESVEDRLRAGKVSTQTIAETMNLMHRAVGVLSGAATTGKAVATDLVDGVNRAATAAAAAAAAAADVAARAAAAKAGGDAPPEPGAPVDGARRAEPGPTAVPPADGAPPPSAPTGDRSA
jgi:hypothetical protein